jgi:hypothetical protein
MGKHQHRARTHHNAEQYKGLDKRGVSDRSDPAQQRGVRAVTDVDRSKPEPDFADRDAENIDKHEYNYPSERIGDIRDIDAERFRVFGSAAPEIRRSFNPSDLNPLLNGPIALKEIDKLDASPLLADDRNVLLTCDGGAILFGWSGPGTYEISEFWYPGFHNSPYAQQAVMIALCWMFSNTDCQTILAKVPYISRISNSPLLIQAPNNVIQILNDRSFKVIK